MSNILTTTCIRQVVRVTPHSPIRTDPSCDICNYTAPSKADVMQHIRSVHCGELYDNNYPRNYSFNSPGAASVSSVVSSRSGSQRQFF
jgi:hypothetical protein